MGGFAVAGGGPVPGRTLTIVPADALPIGTDGLLLPVALALVGLVAAATLVIIARRRLTTRPSTEATESDGSQPGAIASIGGRNLNLPRWLDPSIAAARFRTDTTTAVRAAAATAVIARDPDRLPVVFGGPIDDLTERRLIRYDGVPLLDRPDDVLGQTRWELDGGDEVEILERADIWAQVRTPNGLTGWLPTMTLGSVVAAPAPDDTAEAEPDQPEPELEPVVDELPPLEAILEAIVAQRQARPDSANGTYHAVPAVVDPTPPAPKRTRARAPKGDGTTTQPRAQRKSSTAIDSTPAPEPAPTPEPAPVAAAPKRLRARPATGRPRTARPSARPN